MGIQELMIYKHIILKLICTCTGIVRNVEICIIPHEISKIPPPLPYLFHSNSIMGKNYCRALHSNLYFHNNHNANY